MPVCKLRGETSRYKDPDEYGRPHSGHRPPRTPTVGYPHARHFDESTKLNTLRGESCGRCASAAQAPANSPTSAPCRKYELSGSTNSPIATATNPITTALHATQSIQTLTRRYRGVSCGNRVDTSVPNARPHPMTDNVAIPTLTNTGAEASTVLDPRHHLRHAASAHPRDLVYHSP